MYILKQTNFKEINNNKKLHILTQSFRHDMKRYGEEIFICGMQVMDI